MPRLGDTDNRMMWCGWGHLAAFGAEMKGKILSLALLFLDLLGSHSLCHWPNLVQKPTGTLEKRGEGMDEGFIHSRQAFYQLRLSHIPHAEAPPAFFLGRIGFWHFLGWMKLVLV